MALTVSVICLHRIQQKPLNLRAGKIVPAVGNTANVCPDFSINLTKKMHQQLFHSPTLDLYYHTEISVLKDSFTSMPKI